MSANLPPWLRRFAAAWVTLVDLALVALAVLFAVDAEAPPQDLFWKPLRLEAPLGLATRAQSRRAAADPVACRAALAAGGVRFTDEPDRREGDCRTADAVRLRAGVSPLSPAAPVMTCPQALAYALWDRHSVQPAARAHLGRRVIRVDHFGTYACRRMKGSDEDPLSEHAYANAIDVHRFELAGGRGVSVLRDFSGQGPEGRFLRQVRDGGCDWFRVTLSPDYNAAHRDHLHLDYGRWRLCR